MSLNSSDFQSNFDSIYKNAELYPEGEGYSWRKIPTPLFNLVDLIGASSADLLVALAMAAITAERKQFPRFTAERPLIAKKTGLSLRAITKSIRFLAEKNVISVRSAWGQKNTYKWNENFLKTSAPGSLPVVNDVHPGWCTTFTRGSERGAHIYIEFSLELFITTLEGFFAEHQPPYRFYVPSKRTKKDAPQGSGATISVSRRDAWRDAAFKVYEEIKNQSDALVRIHLALMSQNVEGVQYPEGALRFRVNDLESFNEARSRSHIKQHLHSDEDFMRFVEMKKNQLSLDL